MGTMYLKGSTAKVNFPEHSKPELKEHNGLLLTLEWDSCAECDEFRMSYETKDGIVSCGYSKEVIEWMDTKQVDY